MPRGKAAQKNKGNKGVLGFGFLLVIIGVGLIFTSGVDFSNLPMLDLTARLGPVEVTATDVSPEAQTQMMSGFLIAGIGAVLIKLGM